MATFEIKKNRRTIQQLSVCQNAIDSDYYICRSPIGTSTSGLTLRCIRKMEKQTNNNQIQSWFEKTDFEGSILLEFHFDRGAKTVHLITSFPMGLKKDYHYKFRATEFGDIERINRHNPNSTQLQPISEHFQASENPRTIELEYFQIKTYPTNYLARLYFGHNHGFCDFEFKWIKSSLKKGQLITRNHEKIIIDVDSKQKINFYKPFEK